MPETMVPRWTTEPYDPDDETLVPPDEGEECCGAGSAADDGTDEG